MPSRINSEKIFHLKIVLARVRPLIWRRIEVPGSVHLDQLHNILQAAMGWQDAHMHQFQFSSKPKLPTRAALAKARFDLRKLDLAEIRGVRVYSLPAFELHDAEDESKVTLQELVSSARSRFTYVYDFGDDWIHDITVEKISPPTKAVRYPRCVAGQRACPPEDSGGPQVYQHMVEALKNRKNLSYPRAKEWLGRFNPEKFSAAAANRAVQQT